MNSKRLRVLHVITGLNAGGAEASLVKLVKYDTESVHSVISLTGEGWYSNSLRGIAKEVIPFRSKGLKACLLPFKVFSAIRKQNHDVVQTWMYHADLVGGLAAFLCRVPVVWGIRNSTLSSGTSGLRTRAIVRLNAVLSHVVPKYIISCSEEAFKVHLNKGYCAGRARTVHNGCDVTRFSPSPNARREIRAVLGIRQDAKLFGMVARAHDQKNHRGLLEALRAMTQSENTTAVKLLLVGDGVCDENGVVRRYIRKLGIGDMCLTLGPRSDIESIMQALDVHVLSSTYGEAFPNVLVEAMACGVPCVATDIGESGYILGNTGWTVKPGDVTALSNAMADAAGSMDKICDWEARKQACVNRVRDNFTISKMVSGFRSVWMDSVRPI